MKGLIAALLAVAPLALFGQHQGHTMPTTKKPAVKKQSAKMQTTKSKATSKKATTKKKATDERKTATTRRSSATTKKQADPHKGHATPAKQPTKTRAKQTAKQPDPHQGHGATPPAQRQQQQQGQIPTFPPPEPFPNYDKRGWPKPVMDEVKYSFTLFERLEYLPSGRGGEFAWDVISWHGGDYRRIWVKSEGEQSFLGEGEGGGDIEIHSGRLIKPFVDFLVGARLEGRWGGGSRGRVSIGAGFQALQSYVVESEAFAYISQSGQIYFNATAARDFYLSQRMVLQPRIETNLALNRDRHFGSEAGLQDLDLSLRLRFEVSREFAPYIGVSARWLFGGTASAARSRGEETNRFRFIAGLRFWF